MLNQLVESRENYGDGARRGGYLLTTMMLVAALFASGLLWSLFAKDLGTGNEILELSAIVAPVPMPAEEPPAPEPMTREAKTEKIVKETNQIASRRENILQINETPLIPKDASTAPLINKARPMGIFKISNGAETDASFSSTRGNRDGSGGNGGNNGISQTPDAKLAEELAKDDPPPVLKKQTPAPKSSVQPSLGVVNGKAVTLPKPDYSAAAKTMRIGGDVSVQVTIDETGRVISAKAVSGHPLLRNASEVAARNAKFNPTLLSNIPVKVTGVIIYKFAVQ